MSRTSAGLLLYRCTSGAPEVLLVHPGGPFWARRDDGAWSIPKGEIDPSEPPLMAARREFAEETGTVPSGDFIPLEPVVQPGGKTVLAWAVAGDLDATAIRSNTFRMDWPPRSGREREFPEVDRAAWFPLPDAQRKILPGQVALLAQLREILGGGAPESTSRG